MNLNNLKHEAEQIRLTSAEKSAMHARIFESPSPVAVRQSPYVFMSYQFRMALAGLLLFVVAGTGSVSAAAQGALPGDLLYPIKVSINEKVEVALAPSPAAKAEVQAKLAGRRVEEAQTLAVQGRLDTKTAKALTDDFDEHAAQAVAFAAPEEPETQKSADAPAQATMMVSSAAPEAASSTAGPERERPSIKKSEGRRDSIRESLRVKGELLNEIKIRSQKQELQLED